MSTGKTYWAFISYSSKDKKWGQWLHKRLESYPIPKDFQGTEVFDGAVLGKNLRPVFRDRDELAGSSELGPAILKALQSTRFLIVLCSKNSAQSEWVNKEIADFKAMGKEKFILALILNGEPNATSQGHPEEECFPPELRYPAEPLAGDLRKEGDGKERGFLKILAGITQLDFDKLYRRHERAQAKKRLIASVTALSLVVIFAGLALFAFTQRELAKMNEAEAVKQRDRAEENLNEANDQRRFAEENLSEANTQRERAEIQTEIAEANAQEAKRQEESALKSADLARRNLAEAHYLVGLEMKDSGRPFQAAGMWSKALKVVPDYDAPRRALFFWLMHDAPFSRLLKGRQKTEGLGVFQAFSSDGSVAAFLNDKGVASVLDTASGEIKKIQLASHNREEYSTIKLSPNGKLVLAEGIYVDGEERKPHAKVGRIFDFQDSAIELEFYADPSLEVGGWDVWKFDHTGKYAIGSYSAFLNQNIGWRDIPCVWDVSSGYQIGQFQSEGSRVADSQFNDGVLTFAEHISWMGDEQRVRRLGRDVGSWNLPVQFGELHYGERHSPYHSSAVSHDGNCIAVSTLGDWIYLFQFEDTSHNGGSERIALWNKFEIPTIADVYSARFSEDSRLMVVNTRFYSRLCRVPAERAYMSLPMDDYFVSPQFPFFSKDPGAPDADVDEDFEGLGIESVITGNYQRLHVAEENEIVDWELHQLEVSSDEVGGLISGSRVSVVDESKESDRSFHIYHELIDDELGYFRLIDTSTKRSLTSAVFVEDFYSSVFSVNDEGTKVLVERTNNPVVEEFWIDFNPSVPVDILALDILDSLYGLADLEEVPPPMDVDECLEAIDKLESRCAISVYLKVWAQDYRNSRS